MGTIIAVGYKYTASNFEVLLEGAVLANLCSDSHARDRVRHRLLLVHPPSSVTPAERDSVIQ